MGSAGCGTHSAVITDRVSGTVISTADVLTEVEWTRRLDDVSTARIAVQPEGDCCASLGDVHVWRHKLVISRDEQVVWSGPVVSIDFRQGEVEIFASDILVWLDRRVPHEDMIFTDADLTEIATWLIEDAFAPDDPGHTLSVVGRSKVQGGRQYFQDVGQSGDHLRDLGDTGLDFTAVADTIVLLPEDFEAVVGTLSDADLPDGLVVSEDGASLATRFVVYGDDEGDVKGSSGGSDAYYGLLERSVEELSVKTDSSAAAAARSRRAASFPVPVFLSSDEVTLSPEAAVDVAKLVPGWCLDVSSDATCRRVGQRMKIAGVKVTEDGDGESVKVALAPLSSDLES